MVLFVLEGKSRMKFFFCTAVCNSKFSIVPCFLCCSSRSSHLLMLAYKLRSEESLAVVSQSSWSAGPARDFAPGEALQTS